MSRTNFKNINLSFNCLTKVRFKMESLKYLISTLSWKEWSKLFSFVLVCILLSSCERAPLFNIIGQKEYLSEDFVIGTPLALENIKRVGSVYGTVHPDMPGGVHYGIDIGADVRYTVYSSVAWHYRNNSRRPRQLFCNSVC